MTEMEKALSAITEAGVQIAETPPLKEPVQFQTKRPQTLAEQVQQVERITREIDSRLRREMVEANSNADRLVAEAHAHYARRVSEETARLQRERDEAIRQAVEDYYVKRNELEGLLRRRT